MAPAAMMNPAARPTKVDRASDVTGLVDTGELGTLFTNSDDAIAVLESMTRLAHVKTDLAQHQACERGRRRGAAQAGEVRLREVDLPRGPLPYAGGAQSGSRYRHRRRRDGIFTQAEYNADNEFRKTAAVMKMVINGYAGAGTITMGGYDYHGQGRDTGEMRNFRAGRCIGACLEYAARMSKPLMIYVFSDGSLSANGMVEQHRSTVAASSTGPATTSRPPRRSCWCIQAQGGRWRSAAPTRRQIGSMSAAGDVVTSSSPAANAVNLLVETVILNYMALHGEEGNFASRCSPRHGLGGTAAARCLTMLAPVCSGTVSNPV